MKKGAGETSNPAMAGPNIEVSRGKFESLAKPTVVGRATPCAPSADQPARSKFVAPPAPVPSPKGTPENSPAFQRWVKRKSTQVPKGRQNLEGHTRHHTPRCSAQPQLRRSGIFVAPPAPRGTSPVGAAYSAKIFSLPPSTHPQTMSLLTELGISAITFLQIGRSSGAQSSHIYDLRTYKTPGARENNHRHIVHPQQIHPRKNLDRTPAPEAAAARRPHLLRLRFPRRQRRPQTARPHRGTRRSRRRDRSDREFPTLAPIAYAAIRAHRSREK